MKHCGVSPCSPTSVQQLSGLLAPGIHVYGPRLTWADCQEVNLCLPSMYQWLGGVLDSDYFTGVSVSEVAIPNGWARLFNSSV